MSKLFLVGILASLLCCMPAAGQNRESGKRKVETQSIFRLSTIAGMSVRNVQGKDVGKIEDLVIELNSGEIRYAALSFGGFAGVGDKLFAVPWRALTFKFGEEDNYFVFDVSEEKLKQAPGFDQNRWPDVADAKWSQEIDAFYGDAERAKGEAKPRKARAGSEPVYDAVYRGANITGMKVKNDGGQDLGTINELVIDITKGHVRYAALSFGGIAGLGDKLFAIPWRALALKHDGKDRFFVLNVSAERLKEAQGFDEDRWPNTGDPRWSRDLDEFYKDSTASASGARGQNR